MSAAIVVVGGGPVGMAFALAAARLSNVEVTIVERSAASVTPPAAAGTYDHRVYALSPASLDFLGDLGAAPDPLRACKVRAMQVWGDDIRKESRLDLTQGQPMATIVEHASLMTALDAAVARVEGVGGIRVLRGATPKAMHVGATGRELELGDGTTLRADLLIGADGSRSQIREWAGISAVTKDYESDGVVANFHAEFAHGEVARQWFAHDSVLAYLPLPQQQISIVWSVTKAKSLELGTLGDDAFCEAVTLAGRSALGKLTLASPIARFPLARITATQTCQPGLALIGDAAHAVHPLAGQGVNLGFADARTLCALLGERSRFSGVGDELVLRKYARARREATFAVGEVTDKLRALYMSDAMLAGWVRNDGLALLNRLPHAKAALIDYAVG